MNSDLISRSALLKELCNSCDGWCENTECDCLNCKSDHRCDMVQDIADAPAVDAVEVIKCRDCFYWMKAKVNRSGNLVCPKSGMEIVATDFCSKADKRRCKYDK